MPAKKKKKQYAKARYKYEPRVYRDSNLAEQIIKLRIKGYNFAEISRQLNISYQWCIRLYKQTFEAQLASTNETVNHAIKVDLARIDKLIVRVNNLLDEALTPREHLEAIDCLNRLLDRRAKMLGLNAPEKRIEVSMGLDLNAMSPQELQGEMAKMGIDFDEKKFLEYKLPGEYLEPLVITTKEEVADFSKDSIQGIKDPKDNLIQNDVQEIKTLEYKSKDHHTCPPNLLVEEVESSLPVVASELPVVEGRYDALSPPQDSLRLFSQLLEEASDHSNPQHSSDDIEP